MSTNNVTKTKEQLMVEVKKLLPKLRKMSGGKAGEDAADLAEGIAYALKHSNTVTKKILLDSIRSAEKLIAMPASASTEKVAPKKTVTKQSEKKAPALTKSGKAVETLTKKATAEKTANKPVEVEKPAKATKTPSKAEKPANDTKKAPSKAEKPKKADAPLFPTEIKVETEDGEKVYVIADKVLSLDAVAKAVEKDETLLFAFHWPKLKIRTAYPKYSDKAKNVKSFDDDLDLTTPIYVSDDGTLVHTVSLYSEITYTVLAEEIADNTDGIRVAGDSCYQIYREK